jgi:hypothetical protein
VSSGSQKFSYLCSNKVDAKLSIKVEVIYSTGYFNMTVAIAFCQNSV